VCVCVRACESIISALCMCVCMCVCVFVCVCVCGWVGERETESVCKSIIVVLSKHSQRSVLLPFFFVNFAWSADF